MFFRFGPVLFLSLIVCLFGCGRDGGTPPPSSIANYVNALDNTVNQDDLRRLVRTVRTSGDDDTMTEIGRFLVTRLTDKTKLRIDVDSLSKDSFPFESTLVEGASQLGSGQMIDPMYTTQCLGCRCGRSAWVLEELFGLLLPAFQSSYPDKELARRKTIVEDYMNRNIAKSIRIARVLQLPAAERAEIARDCLSPRLLTLLSADKSVEVQVAVCENIWTPKQVYQELTHRLQSDRTLPSNLRERLSNNCSHNRKNDSAGNPLVRDILATYYLQQYPPKITRPENNAGKYVGRVVREWKCGDITKTIDSVDKSPVFIKQLDDARTFDELAALINDVRKSLSKGEMIALSRVLIKKVSTRKALSFDPTISSDHQFAFESTSISGSMVPGRLACLIVVNPLLWMAGCGWTAHDIGFSGGRAAWAIETLFGLDFPAIQPGRFDEEEIAKRQSSIYCMFDSLGWEILADVARVQQLPKKERLHVAVIQLHPTIQLMLANDPDEEVRMVIRNNWDKIYERPYWTACKNLPNCKRGDLAKVWETTTATEWIYERFYDRFKFVPFNEHLWYLYNELPKRSSR